VFGEHSVKIRGRSCFFNGDKFEHALLRMEFELHEISDQCVNAAAAEYDIFHLSGCKQAINAVASGLVKLRTWDTVKVVSGALQGLLGHVIDVSEGHNVLIESDELHAPQTVKAWELRKMFGRGDFVRAVCGEHRGVEGFIVDMDSTTVSVYQFARDTPNRLRVRTGEEVRS
jgi:ribosomal protein L24